MRAAGPKGFLDLQLNDTHTYELSAGPCCLVRLAT